ncbi:hypothetical protein EYF80_050661 [Liparis tanakae]|uniref:Uncharacterized protein n=1 Tax=Liparis tanakae TaxID=230148 RepID=A0A4Z2FEG5_9TELE|nr:hypothetical protein EYF80_050661 [Liparis tanakae]
MYICHAYREELNRTARGIEFVRTESPRAQEDKVQGVFGVVLSQDGRRVTRRQGAINRGRFSVAAQQQLPVSPPATTYAVVVKQGAVALLLSRRSFLSGDVHFVPRQAESTESGCRATGVRGLVRLVANRNG